MHDAVAVVVRVQIELERVPGVVNPLVRQHVKVVNMDMLVPEMIIWRTSELVENDKPIIPGVSVQQPHVVHQLVGDDPHRVSVSWVETSEDPHSTRET